MAVLQCFCAGVRGPGYTDLQATAHESPLLLRPGRVVQATLTPGDTLLFPTTRLFANDLYSVAVSVPQAERLDQAAPMQIAWELPAHPPVQKVLHVGDSDLYFTYRPHSAVEGALRVTWLSAGPSIIEQPVRVEMRWLGPADSTGISLEFEPNDASRDANPMTLGVPVYGTADDVVYSGGVNPGEGRCDWFVFDYEAETSEQVRFTIDALDPADPPRLQVYRAAPDSTPGEEIEADTTAAAHPGTGRNATGRAARMRLDKRGRYFVRVDVHAPAYVLRSTLEQLLHNGESPSAAPDTPAQERVLVGPPPDAARAPVAALLAWMDPLAGTVPAPVTRTLIGLMSHDEALVRAAAATALGRLDLKRAPAALQGPILAALTAALADPQKIVSQAGAWALRQYHKAAQ